MNDKLNSHEDRHVDDKPEDKKDETYNEEEILVTQKRRGFKRIGPHFQSEPKLKGQEFSCDICGCSLESKGLLDAHSKSHISKTLIDCVKCDEKFENKNDLRNHIEEKHKESRRNIRQFNCLDCAFQGENSLELKRHVERTQHSPCDYVEECYNCGKQFNSYFHLMNHRREEHKSNKTCRYFLQNSCRFEAKECWYKHENKQSEKDVDRCCSEIFKEKREFRKHLKAMHRNEVARCRDFENGQCSLDDNTCWFVHEEKAKNNDDIIHEKANNIEVAESVFGKATKKTPPDQVSLLTEIIKQMTIQMKNLEMMTQVL